MVKNNDSRAKTKGAHVKFDAKNIPFLPKSQFDVFFGEKTKNWSFQYQKLDDDEKRAVKILFAAYKKLDIYRVPKVNIPERVKSPDLSINGVKVEIKNFTSERSLEAQIRYASKQVGEKGWAIFDATKSKLKNNEIQKRIKITAREKHVSGIVIKKQNIIFGFKTIKKEPATHLAYAERPPIHKVNILQGKEKINRLIANTISHTPQKKWLTAALVGNDGHFLRNMRNSIIPPTNNKINSKRKNPATAGYTTHDSGSFQSRIIAHDSKKINQIFGADVRTFKPRQRTKSYWARRSEQRMNEALKYSTSQQKLITRAYTAAQRNLTREVKSLYKNAYKNDQTFDQTKLREIVPNGEISRFKTEMKKAGLKTNLPENYRARANRLEFLQAQIRGELQKVAQKENQISAKIHSETLQNSYYKTIFHTAQGFGATPAGKTRNSAAEVPFLSKKQLDEYFGEDTRGWKFRYSKLRDKEIKAIQATFGANNTKNIYRFPEVDLPLGKKTPDILYKKIPVEIKSITSKSSIEHQVESAHKQLDSKGWAIFSADNSKLKKAEIMNYAKLAIQNHGVSGVFVKDGEKLFAVKTTKKELATRPPFGQRLPVHNITISEKREEINNLFGLQSDKDPGTIRQRAKGPESLSSKIIPQNQTFAKLNQKTINQILTEKFAGKNYSERIWKNTETLAKQLQEILLKNVATGASYEKTARQIRERFKVGKFYAERLARTETAHFENAGEIESYKEMGIEKFQFLATLDKRTSLFCQEMDGKTFKVSEAEPGENVPPLHPNCRSTIVPVFSENFAKNEFRIARNEKGENIYIDAKTKYNDWAKMFEVEKVTAPEPVFAPIVTAPPRDELIAKKPTAEEYAAKIGVDVDYWRNEMEQGERDFVRNFPENNKIQWIKKAEKNPTTGKTPPTNDFIWRGKEWELKSAKVRPQYKTFAGYIRAAAVNGKKNFMVDLHKYSGKSVDRMINGLAKYNERNPKYGVEIIRIFIKNGDTIEVLNNKKN